MRKVCDNTHNLPGCKKTLNCERMEQKYGCHECMINNLFAYLPPKDVSLTMNFFHDHQTSRVGERKTENCSTSQRSKRRE